MNKIILLNLCMLVIFSEKSLASVPENIVFNNQYPLEVRWDAYHKIVTKDKKASISMAKRAVKSKDWFLREAGLKTFVALKPLQAKAIARDMFEKDPSMLVRAQALSAIKILNDKSTEKILWKSLRDPKNFRGDQSLWIRPKVVATLMEFKMGNKDQFKNLLNDKDPQVQRLAQEALKKY